MDVGSSHDREVRFDRLALRKLVLDVKSSSALASFGVPLLSQEGPTCRLLPGAAAPWSPALDPVSKFPADARFVLKSPVTVTFVVVVGLAGPAESAGLNLNFPALVAECLTWCRQARGEVA